MTDKPITFTGTPKQIHDIVEEAISNTEAQSYLEPADEAEILDEVTALISAAAEATTLTAGTAARDFLTTLDEAIVPYREEDIYRRTTGETGEVPEDARRTIDALRVLGHIKFDHGYYFADHAPHYVITDEGRDALRA